MEFQINKQLNISVLRQAQCDKGHNTDNRHRQPISHSLTVASLACEVTLGTGAHSPRNKIEGPWIPDAAGCQTSLVLTTSGRLQQRKNYF